MSGVPAAPPEKHEPSPRPRGRPRDPETDRRILAAASGLMLARGFDKMTVDEVAARAGVGKATVYRRWSSKDDLALAAMAQIFAAEMPETDTGSIRTDLLESYRNVLVFVNSSGGAAFLRMAIAESIRDERVAALYRSSTEQAEQGAAQMYHRAIERGEVRGDIDIPAVVQYLGGVLASRTVTNRPLPTMDDLESLVDFTLDGIRV